MFKLGKIVMTQGVSRIVEEGELDPSYLIGRHARGDWGEIHPGDKGMNEDAVRDGDRIHSVYNTPHGVVWCITESDRSVTTLLLPDEY